MDALSAHVPVVRADAVWPARGGVSLSTETSVMAPAGAERRFVLDVLSAAIRDSASLIIPTRDTELRVLSARRKEFAHYGIDLLVERPDTLETCLDRFQLMAHCGQQVNVPLTYLLDGSETREQLLSLGQPFLVESRHRNASRGGRVITDLDQVVQLPHDGSLIARQLMRGSDFTIEILSRPDGHVVTALPQSPQRTVGGKTVPARTVANRDLQDAVGIGASHVISVQACMQDDGTVSLLDVVPRFAETMTASIAAGVNMAVLAAASVLGADLPDHLSFEEIQVSHLSASDPAFATPPDVDVQSPMTVSLSVARANKAKRLLAATAASRCVTDSLGTKLLQVG
jgi:carbamoyl-phosphate synthase large subunit